MPQLTANYSPALVELINLGQAPVTGIEVGPWFTPRQLRSMKRELPGWQFQFHASGLLTRSPFPQVGLRKIENFLACTHSLWVSVHIELLPQVVYRLSTHVGIHLPPKNSIRAIDHFARMISTLQDAIEIPVILENMASLPLEKYTYAASPATIGELVVRTGCALLLDLAHARLAASYQEMAVENYLEKLPLEYVRQIHISGPRLRNGVLWDAHETLEAEDYDLLAWALARCEPEVVTLEYFRQREALGEQLWILREMLAG